MARKKKLLEMDEHLQDDLTIDDIVNNLPPPETRGMSFLKQIADTTETTPLPLTADVKELEKTVQRELAAAQAIMNRKKRNKLENPHSLALTQPVYVDLKIFATQIDTPIFQLVEIMQMFIDQFDKEQYESYVEKNIHPLANLTEKTKNVSIQKPASKQLRRMCIDYEMKASDVVKVNLHFFKQLNEDEQKDYRQAYYDKLNEIDVDIHV